MIFVQVHMQQGRSNAGHAVDQAGMSGSSGGRQAALPQMNGLRPGSSSPLSGHQQQQGSTTREGGGGPPSWQPLNSSLLSAASVNWSFQNAGAASQVRVSTSFGT